jgi:deoxyribose-phosphate aldolase
VGNFLIYKTYSIVELKVILENSELKDIASIYKLSYLSLCAGADFIKTSTGKGKYGAILSEFIVMCLALRDYSVDKDDTSKGIKAAGGIQEP